tara:strand:+ start:282 stop:689 length:408 start_codon:yes stop_codon:yes gene_type:complete
MIPAAEHIMQARQSDDPLVREVDCSLWIEEGWFSAGRYRVPVSDSEIRQGYWVCIAMALEEEYQMQLSVKGDIVSLMEMVMQWTDNITVINSMHYLAYGSIDADVIAKIEIEHLIADPNVTKIERMIDEDTSEES